MGPLGMHGAVPGPDGLRQRTPWLVQGSPAPSLIDLFLGRHKGDMKGVFLGSSSTGFSPLSSPAFALGKQVQAHFFPESKGGKAEFEFTLVAQMVKNCLRCVRLQV